MGISDLGLVAEARRTECPPVTQLLNLGYNKKLVSRYMRGERQPLQCLG